MSKLLACAGKHLERTAIVSGNNAFSYEGLLTAADSISSSLSTKLRNTSANGASAVPPPRVGLYAAPSPEYLAATWAVWQAGGIVVPLATSHPPSELSYVCQDAGVSVVLSPPDQESRLGPIAQQHGAALQLLEPLTPNTRSSTRSSIINGNRSSSAHTSGSRSGSSGEEEAAAEAAAALAALGEIGPSGGADAGGGCGGYGSGALIMYTSGTTGKPKGVLHTHRSLHAQVLALASSWRLRPADSLLHCLPLHHIHGIVNALYTPEALGAAVEFTPGGRFAAAAVWQRIQSGDISVFMGVPTMYAHLLAAYDQAGAAEEREAAGSAAAAAAAAAGKDTGAGPAASAAASSPCSSAPSAQQAAMRAGAARLRLTVSGSSACPVPIMNRWRELSGQYLLERYGMTEIGMALSNPYQGERRPGSVGLPLPGVEARLAADGELLVRGANVFAEYWGREQATREAFDDEGFFRTGDTASVSGSPPYFTIEGRTSVDIIKSGGYKISALQVESAILEHPALSEVAVLGLPDEAYGQQLTALVAARAGAARPEAEQLQRFCRERLPPYQVPKRWQWVSALPRNAMGKVNKKELAKLLLEGRLPQ